MSTTSQFFGGGGGGGFNNHVVYAASGTWTAPAGVTQVWAKCIGGGGGCGGGTSSNYGGAGGGGSMGMALISVVPTTAYTITVGASGAAGTSTPTAGGNGGTSSFDDDLSAPGGTGGAANTGSGATGGAGGTGVTGADFEIDGEAGGNGSGTTKRKGGNSGGFEAGRFVPISDPTPDGTANISTAMGILTGYDVAANYGQGGFMAAGGTGAEHGRWPGGGGTSITHISGIGYGSKGVVEVRW
jgi:hypothetical protein